jgi:hypothetical protein
MNTSAPLLFDREGTRNPEHRRVINRTLDISKLNIEQTVNTLNNLTP